MKPIAIATTALLATLLLAGCTTTGLSVRERPGASYSSVINTLYEQRATNAAPAKKLAPPFRLAVAQIGETAPPESLRTALEKERYLFSHVTSLPLWTGEQGDASGSVETVRKMARDMNAEYLLVIGGNIDTHESSNLMSFLDLTIVGGAIFPSKDIRSEGKASGVLVDVETGQVMMLVNYDLKKSSMAPSYFSDGRAATMNMELRDKLLVKLGEEFVRQLRERPAMASRQ